LLEHTIGDEALIDATQGIHESLQNDFGLQRDLGKLLQRTHTLEFLGIVDNDLDAKHTFAMVRSRNA
jgi:hypothetical protein